MSAFDDEFGLFGDEPPPIEEDEHRSTLGARLIATGREIVIDEIEPEDEELPRHRGNGQLTPPAPGERPSAIVRRRLPPERRSNNTVVLRERAINLLAFLARGLVAHPEMIAVAAHDDHRQGLVLELAVATEDLGKLIGRGGRIAQALRTVVRAGVEGRVAIEIIDIHRDAAHSSEIALTVNEATEAVLDASDAGESSELAEANPPSEVLEEAVVPPVRRRGRPRKSHS